FEFPKRREPVLGNIETASRSEISHRRPRLSGNLSCVTRMPIAIADLSPEAVIEAIESNLVDASATLGRTMDGVIYRGSDVMWVYTGFPALSRVMLARFPQEEAEDRVAEIRSYFKQWDAGVSWVVGPTSWPPKLGEYLHSQGFGSSELWTGMAMHLATLPPAPEDRPAGLRIQMVTDEA